MRYRRYLTGSPRVEVEVGGAGPKSARTNSEIV